MRKHKFVLVVVLAITALPVLIGCGPKPTKEELEAPPSRGPGTPPAAGGSPTSGGGAMSGGPTAPGGPGRR